MPHLVRTVCNGRPHHAIEYRAPRRIVERLGERLLGIEITDAEAAQGIDALVRRYFPPVLDAEDYHGA